MSKVQHEVKEIRYEPQGEYVLCIAVATDGQFLSVAEAAERRNAAWGVLQELQANPHWTVPESVLQDLTRESKARRKTLRAAT